MTATPTSDLVTARSFLFDDHDDGLTTAQVLKRALSEDGVVRSALRGVERLTSAAVGAVDGEIAKITAELLDVDLGGLLMAGWRRYSELAEAARRTLATPGSEEIVVLTSHRLTSTYSPSIDLIVDGHLLHTFDLSLVVVFDVSGLVAVVRGGALTGLRGAACEATATLSIDETQVATRSRAFDAALVVSVDPPVALVDRAIPTQVVRLDAIEAQEEAARSVGVEPA